MSKDSQKNQPILNDVFVFDDGSRGVVFGGVILNLDQGIHIAVEEFTSYDEFILGDSRIVSHHRPNNKAHICHTNVWHQVWSDVINGRTFFEVDNYYLRSACQKLEELRQVQTVKDLLNASSWTKTETSTDEFGKCTDPFHCETTSWTLEQALIKVYGATPGREEYVIVMEFIREYDPSFSGNTINSWELEPDVDIDDIQYLLEETEL